MGIKKEEIISREPQNAQQEREDRGMKIRSMNEAARCKNCLVVLVKLNALNDHNTGRAGVGSNQRKRKGDHSEDQEFRRQQQVIFSQRHQHTSSGC